MSKPQLRKLKAAGREPGGVNSSHDVKPAAFSEAHQSDDIHPLNSWGILPGGEGVNVEAKPGRVIISQTPICAEVQTVVLNVEECLRIQYIHLSAEEAATGKESFN